MIRKFLLKEFLSKLLSVHSLHRILLQEMRMTADAKNLPIPSYSISIILDSGRGNNYFS